MMSSDTEILSGKHCVCSGSPNGTMAGNICTIGSKVYHFYHLHKFLYQWHHMQLNKIIGTNGSNITNL